MLQIIHDVVNHFVEQSKPFKIEVEFVKVECESVIFVRDGVKQRIPKRDVYATPTHLTVGEKFNIDSRYIYPL